PPQGQGRDRQVRQGQRRVRGRGALRREGARRSHRPLHRPRRRAHERQRDRASRDLMSTLPDGPPGRRPHPSPDGGGRGPDTAEPGPEAPEGRSRASAGRNLPVAIGVGLGLAAIVLASLLIRPVAFLGLAVLAVGVACWETGSAMRRGGKNVPVVPLSVAGALIVVLAWYGGATGLLLGTAVGVAALFVWRLSEGATGYRADVPAASL